jgi:ketosteroid isomerase-like protein
VAFGEIVMKNRLTFAITAVPFVLLAGCEQAAETPAVDPDAVLAAIHEAENMQLAALQNDDVAGAVAVYGEGAALYVDREVPAIGPAAIQANMEAMFSDPGFNAEMDEGSYKSWVSASGDMAVTSFTGQFSRTNAETGEVVTEPMVNQTVWQKQADGSWKNVHDVNMVYAAEAVEEAAETPAE